ncbi:hypothetical protein FMEXI_8147 [Fusarium mexicanum]|uniref:DUF7580 domain-containing protein n=1 Tax=Fusarium mexicanum TaxID=751941 RepID=A0A8H5IS58_9HYPO|nr:hypothetical protein FMEXI_8147 [Fusarium mexicanum]
MKANKRLMSAGGLAKFEFKRAVKLTMKRKEVRILLEDMKACNNRLDEFINKSEAPSNNSTAGTTVGKLGLSSSLQQIQSYATMLHQTLGKAWSCSTHASHEIRLLLEDRVVRHNEPRSLKRVKPSTKPPCFTITHKSPMSSALWKSARIEIIDSDQEADQENKTIRFKEVHPRRCLQDQQRMNIRSIYGLTVVGDLCTVFRRYNGFGFGLDDQGVLYETYQDELKPVCCAENLISLEELLLAHSGMDCFTPLTEEQRYRLSIILTSSFLQLHSTPWLNKYWNQHAVFFSSTSIDDQLVIDLGHPFLTESYGSSPRSNANSIEAKGLTDDSANLLMLAKILLQIKFHGRTSRTSITKSKENTSNSTAFDRVRESQLLNQWIFRERENLSFAHYNAIQFCIASSNSIDVDLWDLKYRQIVLDRVVVPLVNELSHWQGVV